MAARAEKGADVCEESQFLHLERGSSSRSQAVHILQARNGQMDSSNPLAYARQGQDHGQCIEWE
jgi:hypothetical protein